VNKRATALPRLLLGEICEKMILFSDKSHVRVDCDITDVGHCKKIDRVLETALC
jgi:hypothetical protein